MRCTGLKTHSRAIWRFGTDLGVRPVGTVLAKARYFYVVRIFLHYGACTRTALLYVGTQLNGRNGNAQAHRH